MEGLAGSDPPAWSPMPRSCNTCRQRKVKCDKSQPCGACERYGIQCVFPGRTRASRVKRSAGKARDSELLQRISRLENLVHKVKAESGIITETQGLVNDTSDIILSEKHISSVQSAQEAPRTQQQARQVGDHYLSGDFWTTLSDEVDGLKQMLDHPSDDDDEDPEESKSNSAEPNQLSPSNFIFRDHETVREMDLAQPSETHRAIFVGKYFENVSPICRILHEPTVTVALLGNTMLSETGSSDANAKYDIKPKAKAALLFSMCFAAITSMTTVDCLASFGEDRETLLVRYKFLVESALNYADFLNSMDIVPLQAFAIYLMAIRAHNKDRTSWTLVGLAVRIAHSLNLHRDGDGLAFSAFEAELRRRLWWQIVVIDMRASEDRGSETVVTNDSFNTRMPLNIQDEDFGPDSPHPLPQRSGVSNMSFSLLSMDVSNTIRRLNFIPPAADETNSAKHLLTMKQKEDLVRQCTNRIENQYLLGCDPSIPSMSLLSTLGQLLVVRLWLALQYPLQSRRLSPWPRYPGNLGLRSAVTYLELTEITWERVANTGQDFWTRQYVPWHAMAVALAELCSQTEGELVERGWAIIDKTYDKWSDQVADSKEGMLWRPIKKLLAKAKAVRRNSQKIDAYFAVPQIQATTDTTAMDLPFSVTDKFNDCGLATQSMLPPQPAPGFPPGPSISEIPHPNNDLSAYSYDTPTLPTFGSLPPLTSPGLGLEWLQVPDVTALARAEVSDGQPNWDDWNEFINGAGEVGAQVDIDNLQWDVLNPHVDSEQMDLAGS